MVYISETLPKHHERSGGAKLIYEQLLELDHHHWMRHPRLKLCSPECQVQKVAMTTSAFMFHGLRLSLLRTMHWHANAGLNFKRLCNP